MRHERLIQLVRALIVGVTTLATAQAAPVKIEFQGVQFSDPTLIRGAANELGIDAGRSVNGGFELDTAGAVDAFASNPLKTQYYGVVSKSWFESVNHSSGDFYLSYYFIDTNASNIQFYASTFLNGVFELLTLSLDVKAGVISNDQFDITTLTTSKLISGTWGMQRTHFDVSSSAPPVVVYGGFRNTSISISALESANNIPEPNVFALLGLGFLAIAAFRKRAMQQVEEI